MRGWLVAALFVAVAAAPAAGKTFHWASDADVRSLDPYAGREVFLRSFDANIYEPLVRRGRALALEPALATRWSQSGPNRWRFALRRGVVFQDGAAFTAADVIFSFRRARAPTSKLGAVLAPIRDVVKLDDHTVEFITNGPDPILPDELTGWGIMSQAWCAAHDATEPTDLARDDDNYANTHADGTGPFMVAVRRPEAETVLVANPRWWDTPRHDLDRVVFQPIANDDVRVNELLSGRLDMIDAVPPQDIARIAAQRRLHIVKGPGLETIFLGFDQHSATLTVGGLRQANPFKDRRVREAIARAIDEDAIARRLMRGLASPSALLVAPGVDGFDPALDRRPPYDPAAARKLLQQAGYAHGFSTGMSCPTDRYVNDAAICATVVTMLAKIGITVDLDAQSRAQYFTALFAQDPPPNFYLFGWAPATDDAENALINLAATPDPARHAGDYNFGGYANPALDALIARIAGEADRDERRSLMRRALKLIKDDVAYLPLHQQDVVWAARDGVVLEQRADGAFPLRYVQVK